METVMRALNAGATAGPGEETVKTILYSPAQEGGHFSGQEEPGESRQDTGEGALLVPAVRARSEGKKAKRQEGVAAPWCIRVCKSEPLLTQVDSASSGGGGKTEEADLGLH